MQLRLLRRRSGYAVREIGASTNRRVAFSRRRRGQRFSQLPPAGRTTLVAAADLAREHKVSVATGSGALSGMRKQEIHLAVSRCHVRVRRGPRPPRPSMDRATAALPLAGVTILVLKRTRPQRSLHRAMISICRQIPLRRKRAMRWLSLLMSSRRRMSPMGRTYALCWLTGIFYP